MVKPFLKLLALLTALASRLILDLLALLAAHLAFLALLDGMLCIFNCEIELIYVMCHGIKLAFHFSLLQSTFSIMQVILVYLAASQGHGK